MAEEEKKEGADVAVADEAAELEKILGEGEEEGSAQAGLVGKITGLLKKFIPKSKKAMIITGASALVLLLAVGGGLAYYFIHSPGDTEEAAEKTEEAAPPPKEEEKEDSFILKTGIYALAPFLMPLNLGPSQGERFLNIKINLLMSNRRMEKGMEKNLAPLRREIYKVLKRKKVMDYTQNKAKLKTRLKQEIGLLANSFIEGGAGTIDEVFFTQFVVK